MEGLLFPSWAFPGAEVRAGSRAGAAPVLPVGAQGGLQAPSTERMLRDCRGAVPATAGALNRH